MGGQLHGAQAKPVQGAQQIQVAVEVVAAFQVQEGRDPAAPDDPFDVRGVEGQADGGRVLPDLVQRQLHDPERVLDLESARIVVLGRVDREEHRVDAALLRPGQVDVAVRDSAGRCRSRAAAHASSRACARPSRRRRDGEPASGPSAPGHLQPSAGAPTSRGTSRRFNLLVEAADVRPIRWTTRPFRTSAAASCGTSCPCTVSRRGARPPSSGRSPSSSPCSGS